MAQAESTVGLRDELYTLTVEALKPLARRCMGNLPSIRKDDLVKAVLEALQSRDFVGGQVKEADETTRLALAEAAYGDGSLNEARFEAKYGRRFATPRHHSSYGSGRTAVAAVADLFFYQGRVPVDLIPMLKSLLPGPAPFVVPTREDLPEKVKGVMSNSVPLERFLTEEGALHDLLATLNLVGEGRAAISEATRQPTATTVRLLKERFLLPDIAPTDGESRADESIRPFAFVLIVQAAGLVRVSGNRLALSKTGQAALESPSPTLLKVCWEAWIAKGGLDELSRIRGIKGQKSKGVRLSRPSQRRDAIAAALADCPAGRWIGIRDFLRHVRANHDFDVDTADYTRFYVGNSQEYGWLGYNHIDFWQVVNGSYIRAVLLEYAATLGLIDVATIPPEEADWGFNLRLDLDESYFSRYDGLLCLRVNPLGSYILGQSDTYEGPALPQEQPALTVLPSLDVVVTHRADLTPNERAILERFSARVSDDVYKLSRDSLLAAAEGGLAVEDAGEFLRRRSRRDLPQTVEVLLQDAARGAAMLQPMGSALLIRCGDPTVAQLIAHDRALAKLCLLAGEDHLVVPDRHLAAFRRGLKRLGYALPAGKGS